MAVVGQVVSGVTDSLTKSTHCLMDTLDLPWGYVGPGHSAHWVQPSLFYGGIKIKLRNLVKKRVRKES